MLLNTLAQSGTQKNNEIPTIDLVSGKGTDILNNPSLANRAKRKLITRKMVLSLIYVAKEKGEPKRVQAYWNAYHCLNNVIVTNGKGRAGIVKTDSAPFVMQFVRLIQSIVIIRSFLNGKMFSL